MLNIALVGGAKVEDVAASIQSPGFKFVKTHQFVADAFDDILNNYAEYLDIDVIIVLQYGIKDNEDTAGQIRDLQEVISVSRIPSKLYYVLKDLTLYNSLESDPDAIVYSKARVLYLSSIQNKKVTEILEGKMDNQGLAMEVEVPVEEYTEDGLDLPEIAPEDKVFKFDNEPSPEPIIEDEPGEKPQIGSLGDLRKKGKNKKKGLFGAPPVEEDKEPEPFVDKPQKVDKPKKPSLFGGSGEIRFTGVLGVTGDRSSGISTTVANLAETFAKQNKTVLIIDLDLFRRSQSVIFTSFKDYKNTVPKSQLGVYYALNNTGSIEDVAMIVKDNIALLGNSRKNEYYTSPFVDKSLEDIATSGRINTLIGVAKGLFDVVILDFPIDQMKHVMESTIIADKFILCVENNMHQIDTLFNLEFGKLMIDYDLYVNSIIAKSCVVLTKYSSHSKYGRQEMTEDLVQEMLQSTVYPRIEVAGKISYSNVFANVGSNTKSLIDLHDTTRNEFLKIAQNIHV